MEYILSERWRPKTVEDCILPESTKNIINGLILEGNIPSLLFTGSAGCGKTTLARAIAYEMGADMLFINASLEGSVDTIRTKVTQFASTVSFTNSKKITVLDEADGLSAQAMGGLRGLIEEFGNNHSIIFTANFAQKIIEPIRSRCKVIDFKISSKDKNGIAAKFLKRVFTILDTEKIEYEKEAVVALVMKKFPDFRSVMNELQGYAAGGKIDSGILANLSEESFNQLTTSLKNKKFNELRKWVSDNSDLESVHFFRMFYEAASEKLESKSIPELILILGKYSFEDGFVVDKEILRMAFLVTLMTNPSIIWR